MSDVTSLSHQYTTNATFAEHINAWVQNTRPIVLQHSEIAQQLQASLPAPTG